MAHTHPAIAIPAFTPELREVDVVKAGVDPEVAVGTG